MVYTVPDDYQWDNSGINSFNSSTILPQNAVTHPLIANSLGNNKYYFWMITLCGLADSNIAELPWTCQCVCVIMCMHVII